MKIVKLFFIKNLFLKLNNNKSFKYILSLLSISCLLLGGMFFFNNTYDFFTKEQTYVQETISSKTFSEQEFIKSFSFDDVTNENLKNEDIEVIPDILNRDHKIVIFNRFLDTLSFDLINNDNETTIINITQNTSLLLSFIFKSFILSCLIILLFIVCFKLLDKSTFKQKFFILSILIYSLLFLFRTNSITPPTSPDFSFLEEIPYSSLSSEHVLINNNIVSVFDNNSYKTLLIKPFFVNVVNEGGYIKITNISKH